MRLCRKLPIAWVLWYAENDKFINGTQLGYRQNGATARFIPFVFFSFFALVAPRPLTKYWILFFWINYPVKDSNHDYSYGFGGISLPKLYFSLSSISHLIFIIFFFTVLSVTSTSFLNYKNPNHLHQLSYFKPIVTFWTKYKNCVIPILGLKSSFIIVNQKLRKLFCLWGSLLPVHKNHDHHLGW